MQGFDRTQLVISITEVACWAHCHGRFFDVWQATKSPVAKEALDRIAAIYVIEAKAQFAPAAERVEHRKETPPLLDAFFAWADGTVVKLSAKSALAEAFRYTIKRRKALSRFVTDGRLEADNNIAENAVRACHSAGAEELPLLWLRYRRRSCRFHLYSRADGQAQRCKSRGVPQGYPDKDCRRAPHQSDRRAYAVADAPRCHSTTAVAGDQHAPDRLRSAPIEGSSSQEPVSAIPASLRHTWQAKRLPTGGDRDCRDCHRTRTRAGQGSPGQGGRARARRREDAARRSAGVLARLRRAWRGK